MHEHLDGTCSIRKHLATLNLVSVSVHDRNFEPSEMCSEFVSVPVTETISDTGDACIFANGDRVLSLRSTCRTVFEERSRSRLSQKIYRDASHRVEHLDTRCVASTLQFFQYNATIDALRVY